MESFHYRPWQARPYIPLLALALAAVLAALHLLFGGTLLPVLPPQSTPHALAWMLLGVAPLSVLQVGWAYELTQSDLVVTRFGAERYRVALRTYRGRTIFSGMPRLRFDARTVLLVSGPDEERAAFLDALDERALACGGGAPLDIGAKIAGERITVRSDMLTFPPGCARCENEATTTVELLAERGWDLVVSAFVQFVPVAVPVCRAHATSHRNTRWGAYGAVFVAVTLATFIPMMLSSGVELGLAMFVGASLGALSMRVAEACKLSRFVSYRAIGIAAVGLDADLTRVTLRVRDPDLRAALAGSESVKVLARVFD